MVLNKHHAVYQELMDTLRGEELRLNQDFQRQTEAVRATVKEMRELIERACLDENGSPRALFREMQRLHQRVNQIVSETNGDLSPQARGLISENQQTRVHRKKKLRFDTEAQDASPKLTNRIGLDLPGNERNLMQSKKLVAILGQLRKKRDLQTIFNGRCQIDENGMFMMVKPEDLTGVNVDSWKKMQPGQRIAALENALIAIANRE